MSTLHFSFILLFNRGMMEASIAYCILLIFLLKIIFHYVTIVRSRNRSNQSKRSRICTLYICSHEEAYVKLLDNLQTVIVLFAVLLLRPHNHLPVALHLAIFYAISHLLWPVVIDNNLSAMKGEIISRSGVLNSYQVVARVLLAYWFGQHTFFTLVRNSTLYCIALLNHRPFLS